MRPENFTRINNDVDGNPRYVIHFLKCEPNRDYTKTISGRYASVVKLMNKIGGRKYHTKSYGGGIVFTSYNLNETIKAIQEVIK